MKTYRFSLLDVATAIVTVTILAMALWTATQAPDVAYPMHFNARGEPDRWGDRNELALLLGDRAPRPLDVRARPGMAAIEEQRARPDVDRVVVLTGEIMIEPRQQ